MLIAVSADGQDLSSAVSDQFDTCRWLLFVETDDLTYLAAENAVDGATLARAVVERDCEAVITGALLPETFNILADGCVTRYCGLGFTVRDALRAMDSNTLTYIRFADENDTCHGDHSGSTCDCGEDHD